MTDITKQTDRCNCETCRPNSILDPEGMRMILCSLCGNKRCPHATDHRNPCTNSNDVGQVGSSYEKAWDPRADLVKPIQAEPVAYMRQKDFGYLKTDEGSAINHSALVYQKNSFGSYPVQLYTHPAPALTAELREELLEALGIGERAVDHDLSVSILSKDECSDEWRSRYFKIRAAITKLTNLVAE